MPEIASIQVETLFHEERRRCTMEDAQIIELFFARSEDAISELDKKYESECESGPLWSDFVER